MWRAKTATISDLVIRSNASSLLSPFKHDMNEPYLDNTHDKETLWKTEDCDARRRFGAIFFVMPNKDFR